MTELWAQALRVGDAFRPLLSLGDRTRLLSLNASVAAARLGPSGRPFAVVAGAVHDLGGALAELVAEIERDQLEIVTAIAAYNRAERNLALLRAAGRRAAGGGAFDPSSARAPQGLEGLARATAATGDRMYGMLAAARLVSVRLERAAAAVQRTAHRNGNFIGTNARVEATRIGSAELTVLGDDLYALTAEMAATVAEAAVEAHGMARTAERVLGSGGSRGEVTGQGGTR